MLDKIYYNNDALIALDIYIKRSMGSATGLKLGGPKPFLNLTVNRSLILIYRKLRVYKILIKFKY